MKLPVRATFAASMVFGATRLLSGLVEGMIRRDYPNASDREVFLRVASRHLDRETMIAAYGWDPERLEA